MFFSTIKVDIWATAIVAKLINLYGAVVNNCRLTRYIMRKSIEKTAMANFLVLGSTNL